MRTICVLSDDIPKTAPALTLDVHGEQCGQAALSGLRSRVLDGWMPSFGMSTETLSSSFHLCVSHRHFLARLKKVDHESNPFRGVLVRALESRCLNHIIA